MLRSLWLTVGVHLWQTTLVLAVIFLVATLTMRRAPARLVHVLWTAALLKLLLPLPWLGRLSGRWLPASLGNLGSPELGGLGLDAFFATVLVRPAGATPAGLGIDPYAILTLAWLAGATCIALSWLSRSRRFRREDAAGVPDPRLAVALVDSGIPATRVRLVRGSALPAVSGLARPRIIVSERLVAELEPIELRAVLLHEEAHRRRGDLLLGAVARLAVLCFFYYPPLWPLLRRLHGAAEMACDEYTLARGIPQATYVRALARTVRLGLGPAPSVALAGRSLSLLGRRFRRIAGSGRYVAMRRHHFALLVSCLLVVTSSFLPLPPVAATAEENDPRFAELRKLAEAELPVQLNFKGVELARVFEALSATATVEVTFEGAGASQLIDVEVGRTSLREALIEIGRRARVRYRVPDPDTLVVQLLPALELPGANGVTPPTLLEGGRVAPRYPDRAREAGVEGRVILQAVITGEGRVEDVKVLRSTTPDRGFEEAAVEAVRQWRYAPAMRDGDAVDVYFTVMLDFDLDGEQ